MNDSMNVLQMRIDQPYMRTLPVRDVKDTLQGLPPFPIKRLY
jgi:hypothetical protein